MGNNVFKYIKYLLYVLMGGGVAVLIYVFAITAIRSEPDTTQTVGTVGEWMATNVMLWYAYILIAIAIIVAVIFPIVNIIKNPKGAMTSLIGLGIMVVIVAVSYLLSSSEPIQLSDGTWETSTSALRISDTGLFTAYVMVAGTLLIILGTEIMNAVRNRG